VLKRALQRGFSLVELADRADHHRHFDDARHAVVLRVHQQCRLGSVAQSFYSGLSLARSEAIRLNVPVEFVMTNDPVGPESRTRPTPDVTGEELGDPQPDGEPGPVRTRRDRDQVGPRRRRRHAAGDDPGGIPDRPLQRHWRRDTWRRRHRDRKPARGRLRPGGSGPVLGGHRRTGGQVRLCVPAAPFGDTRSCTP
jgi:hypothetical protein